MHMFEIAPDMPHFMRLSPFTASSGHQALAFHHKNVCDVMDVEFQRAWRLTEKTTERVSFK